MKKLLLSILAIAAITACSKSEVEYDAPAEIGISPVTQNRTKAIVSGTEFPANENFMVWSWYKQLDAGTSIADWQKSSVAQQLYIDEKTFVPRAGKTGLWGGQVAYYWPKIGSLLFAGYYPATAEMKALVSYEFNSTVNKMTVAGFTPGNYQTTGFVNNATGANHVEDFMYFNMTASSSDANTVGDDNSVKTGSQIDVYFRHALSWITVVLAEAEGTPEGATITVNSVKFTDVKTTGTGTVDNSPTAPKTNEISWVTTDAKTDVVVLSTDKVLGDAETLDKQPVVIPQGMAGKLVITYTVSSPKDSEGVVSSFTETKEITLADIDSDNTSWLPGRKYTYSITIGTSEILLDPIITDWVVVDPEIEIGTDASTGN